MLIQAYNDGLVRVFDGRKNELLCEFEVSPPLKPLIDKHLHRLRIYRSTKWFDGSWGSEANARFKGKPTV
jgi:hypothetical protein